MVGCTPLTPLEDYENNVVSSKGMCLNVLMCLCLNVLMCLCMCVGICAGAHRHTSDCMPAQGIGFKFKQV